MSRDPLTAEIARLADGIAALRIVRKLIRTRGQMGKLSAIADRIRDTKTKLEAEADKLGAKLDGIDKAAPTAFSRGHAFLDSQAAEVAEIEDTLRQLSNLPLDASTSLPDGSAPYGRGPSSDAAEIIRQEVKTPVRVLDAHRSFDSAGRPPVV